MSLTRMIRASLVVTLVFAPVSSWAADDTLQNYDVELLVFRVTRPNATAENWALEQSLGHSSAATAGDSEDTPITVTTTPGTTSSTGADTASTSTDTNFPPLAATQFKLNSVEEALRKTRSYQPIAHFGWTQPGFPPNNAVKFPLQIPGFLPDNIVLSGQALLARGPRYLHLLLDITYQAPDGQKYVLREQRRMRSTEKHYFDHPYFGVITAITPKS